jgi:predicted restriction endonuclease
MFLFGRTPPSEPERSHEDLDEVPFEETTTRRRAPSSRVVRPGQRAFKFDVISRYGARCAFCDISVPDLLRAAHIRPVHNDGSDDARNGLPLCENHHAAFDAGLIRINLESLALEVPCTLTPTSLQITRADLKHLPKMPAAKALKWRHTSCESYRKQRYDT